MANQMREFKLPGKPRKLEGPTKQTGKEFMFVGSLTGCGGTLLQKLLEMHPAIKAHRSHQFLTNLIWMMSSPRAISAKSMIRILRPYSLSPAEVAGMMNGWKKEHMEEAVYADVSCVYCIYPELVKLCLPRSSVVRVERNAFDRLATAYRDNPKAHTGATTEETYEWLYHFAVQYHAGLYTEHYQDFDEILRFEDLVTQDTFQVVLTSLFENLPDLDPTVYPWEDAWATIDPNLLTKPYPAHVSWFKKELEKRDPEVYDILAAGDLTLPPEIQTRILQMPWKNR